MMNRWSHDYHFLISGGFEHEALVWIANIDCTPFRLQDHRVPHQASLIGCFAVPNTPQVITTDQTGMIKIWDIRTFQCIQTLNCEPSSNSIQDQLFHSCAYSHKYQQIITSGRKIYIHEYEKTEKPHCADDDPISYAAYNSTKMSFITASGKNIKIWNAITGKNKFKNLIFFFVGKILFFN